jgi:tetratricopeptide (TPR) repeat protein
MKKRNNRETNLRIVLEDIQANPEDLRRSILASGGDHPVSFGNYKIAIQSGKNLNPSVDVNINGDVTGNIIIGNNNTITGSVPNGGQEALEIRRMIEEIQGAIKSNRYDRSLLDYFHALRLYSEKFPYLSLDELLGSDRKLYQVYVPLRIQPGNNDKALDAIKTTTINEVLHEATNVSKSNHVLIFGEPGAGKSTLLRQIARNAWDAPSSLGLSRPYLPIPIQLSSLALANGVSVESRLLDALKISHQMVLDEDPPDGFWSEWSQRMNAGWLLLLDGLDEVPTEQQAAVISWLQDLIRLVEGKNHHIIITSRPNIDKQVIFEKYFSSYDLLPLQEEQQKQLAYNWLGDQGAGFLIKLNQKRIGTTQGTPLLLTLAMAIYLNDNELPARRSSIYERFIQIWIGDPGGTPQIGQSHRRGIEQVIGKDLSGLLHLGLERIALAMTKRPWRNSLDDLSESVKEMIGEATGLTGPIAHNKSRQFVQALGQHSGLLIQKGDLFEWAHPTFREYLCASALVHLYEKNKEQTWHFVLSHWRRDNWREIVLFALSILSGQGKYLSPLMAKILERNGSLGFIGDVMIEQINLSPALTHQIIEALLEKCRTHNWRNFRQRGPLTLMFEFAILAKIEGSPQVVEGLAEILKNPDIESVSRSQAILALESLGQLDLLLKLMSEPSVHYKRSEIAEVLGHNGYVAEAETFFLKELWLENGKGHFYSSSIRAIEDLGRAETLLSLVNNPEVDARFRIQALTGAAKLGNTTGTLMLIAQLEREIPEKESYEQAIAALASNPNPASLFEQITKPKILIDVRTQIVRNLFRASNNNRSILQVEPNIAYDKSVDPEFRLEIAQQFKYNEQKELAIKICRNIGTDSVVNATSRQKAGRELIDLGQVDEAVAILIPLLSDSTSNLESRIIVAEALEKSGHKEHIVEPVKSMLMEKELTGLLRKRAIELLEKSGATEDASAAWRAMAYDEEGEIWWRGWGAEGLAKIGHKEDAAQALLKSVHDGKAEGWRRRDCAISIQKMDQRVIGAEAWRVILRDRSVSTMTHSQAVESLAKWNCTEARQVLVEMVKDDEIESQIRLEAAMELINLGASSEISEFTYMFYETARDDNAAPTLRVNAAKTLSQLNLKDDSADLLLDLSTHLVDYDSKEKGIDALIHLGYKNYASTALMAMLDEPDISNWKKVNCAKKLGALGNLEPAVQVLSVLARLEDKSEYSTTNLMAADALIDMGDAQVVVEALTNLVQNGNLDRNIHLNASKALVKIGIAEPALPTLVDISSDIRVDHRIRVDAAQTISDTDHPAEAVRAWRFIGVQEDMDMEIRLKSAEKMIQLGDSKAPLPILRDLLDDHEEIKIFVRAAIAMIQLGYVHEVEPSLSDVIGDPRIELQVRIDAATALLDAGKIEQSVEFFLRTANSKIDSYIRKNIAKILTRSGYTSEAAEIWTALLTDTKPAIRIEAAEALYKLGNKEKVVNSLMEVVRDEQINPNLLINPRIEAAGLLKKIGEISAAEDAWLILLQSAKTSSHQRGSIIRELVQLVQQGITHNAMQSNQTEYERLLNLGAMYASKPDYARAELIFRVALDLNPEKIDAKTRLMSVLTRRGEVLQAMELGKKAVAEHPNDSYLRYLFSEILTLTGDDEQALTELQTAYSLNPNIFDQIKSMLLRPETLAEHVAEFRSSLEKQNITIPSTWDGTRMVEWQIKLKRALAVNDGIAYYETLDELMPDAAPQVLDLADAYQSAGENKKALSKYLHYAKLMPQNPLAYSRLAEVYSILGDHKRAVAAYLKARKLMPVDPEIWYSLGQTNYELGRMVAAIHAFKMAIKIDPSNANFYHSLARIYEDKGVFEEAINLYQTSYDLRPRPSPLNAIGYIFLKQDNFFEANAYFSRALDQESNYVYALINLGITNYGQGKVNKGLEIFVRAAKMLEGQNADEYNLWCFTWLQSICLGEKDSLNKFRSLLLTQPPALWIARSLLDDTLLLSKYPAAPVTVLEVLSALKGYCS